MVKNKDLSDLVLKEKLWEIVEGYIDERFFTNLITYRELRENKDKMQDIVDSITDLSWELQQDMQDSL